MAKTWVLDSETKGTGAHVAPLRETPAGKPEPELALVRLERAPRVEPDPQPERKRPPSFKVVDVRSARVLGEGIGARETVGLLEEMGSVTDARVYLWSAAAARWRLLSLEEQKALWRFRTPRAAG